MRDQRLGRNALLDTAPVRPLCVDTLRKALTRNISSASGPLARAPSTLHQQPNRADVRPRSRSRPEDIIQRAVFEHLRVRGEPSTFLSTPPMVVGDRVLKRRS
jgi:hypothetical protein